jgi:hypothetical protein
MFPLLIYSRPDLRKIARRHLAIFKKAFPDLLKKAFLEKLFSNGLAEPFEHSKQRLKNIPSLSFLPFGKKITSSRHFDKWQNAQEINQEGKNIDNKLPDNFSRLYYYLESPKKKRQKTHR